MAFDPVTTSVRCIRFPLCLFLAYAHIRLIHMSRSSLHYRSIRLSGAFLLLLGTLFASQEGSAASSANLFGDWTTYGNGPAHTGYFPGTLDGLPFIQKWKEPTPNWNVSQAATGGGRVFITTGWYFGTMYLMSFDAETGQPLRTNNFGSWFSINPPTYSDGAVYLQRVDSSSSQMSRFDAVTLAPSWSKTFTAQGSYYMAPIVVDGTVYADTGYYVELTAYNRVNGAPRFSVPLIGNGCDEWTPTYDAGKVYTWVNGIFTEHDPSTGARNWALTNATQSEFLYSMERTVAIADGRAYFTSTTKLLAVDLAAHANAWEVPGNFSGTPAVANGIVYAISNSVVNAYATNGVFLRRYDTAKSVEKLSDQLIVTDDVLIAAGKYGVYIFTLSDGTLHQLISSFRTPCYCYSASKISLSDNTLYVSSGDSSLYAYSASNLWRFTIDSSSGINGSPSPHPYGTNYVIGDTLVTNTVPSPIAGPANTRYLVTGWTGTGSVPASGNTNTVIFLANSDSTLTWQMKTQYFLNTGVNGNGSVDVPDAWQDGGSNITITATPATYYHFSDWSGDVTGTSNILTVPMDGPRTVTAYFSANLLTNDVPEWWLAQNGLPVSDAGALEDTDEDRFQNWKEYRAGTKPKDPTSYLQLTATLNPGRLVLRWPSASGRRYRLFQSTNLGTGFLPLATNIYGYSSYTSYYLNQPIPDPSFYKIQIE